MIDTINKTSNEYNNLPPIEDSGLVVEGNKEPSKIYLTINAEGKFIRRVKGEQADEMLQREQNNDWIVDPKTNITYDGFRIRTLGPNSKTPGGKVVEQIIDRINEVEILNCFTEPGYNNVGVNMVVVLRNPKKPEAPHVYLSLKFFDGEKTEDYSGNFLERSPNLDVNKTVNMVPYNFEDKENGKRRRGITLYQDNVKIESAFGKDKGDKPMAKEHKIKGSSKVVWVWKEVGEFQEKLLKDFTEKLKNRSSNISKNNTMEFDEVESMPF